ncbi:hypothetical protein QUF64_14315 [Anaerolineales bacterium HSG6]|nr:hypothetical protein [Anaerolineales bacterium HSG6]
MKSLGQLKVLVPLMLLFVMSLGVMLPSTPARAQGTPKPTPTTIPNDGGSKGDGNPQKSKESGLDDGKHGGGISGHVFNYSTGGPQGNVLVVLEGPSWRVETVSDSNGFYQIGNLGNGTGVLNVRLPMVYQPVNANWPVTIERGIDQTANLGYYTGPQSSLPVQLSAVIENGILYAQIENNTDVGITNGRLSVYTPDGMPSSQSVQVATSGSQYSQNGSTVQMAEMAGSERVDVQMALDGVSHIVIESADYDASDIEAGSHPFGPGPAEFAFRPKIEVIFEYDQQPTAQIIAFAPDGSPLYGQVAASPLPTEINMAETANQTVTTEIVEETEQAPSAEPASVETKTSNEQAVATDGDTEVQPQSLMPVTGYNDNLALNMGLIVLAILIGGGLLAGGWHATRTKRY